MELMSIGKFARKLRISVNKLCRIHSSNELISIGLRHTGIN